MDVRLLQPMKASCPMLVTLSGMVIELKLPKLRKASCGMVVVPSRILRLINKSSSKALSQSKLAMLGFSPMPIDVKLLQPVKAPLTISVRLSGMIIELRLLHSMKALLPMLVTPSEMMIELRLLQPPKALSLMTVMLSGMMIELRLLQS